MKKISPQLKNDISELELKNGVRIEEMKVTQEYQNERNSRSFIEDQVFVSCRKKKINRFISKYAPVFLLEKNKFPNFKYEGDCYRLNCVTLFISYNHNGCFKKNEDGVTFSKIENDEYKKLWVDISNHREDTRNLQENIPGRRIISFSSTDIIKNWLDEDKEAIPFVLGVDEFIYAANGVITTPYKLVAYKMNKVNEQFLLETDENGNYKEYIQETTIKNIIYEALHIYPFNIIL